MASISSTSSSLSTTLRGFGGMASGIDRDSIIEQMSLGTTTKIQNQKNAITSLTWKQEAFQNIINQILDFQDNYLSYAAKTNVTDRSLFSKSVITANGDEKISKLVSVSGSSDMLDSMTVKGVEQLATSANFQSDKLQTGTLETEISFSNQPKTSNLSGTKLIFGHPATEGRFTETAAFSFPTSYKDEDGNTVEIEDYTTEDMGKLADQLNEAIKANEFQVSKDLGVTIKFSADGDNLQMRYVKTTNNGSFEVTDEDASEVMKNNNMMIRKTSSALGALGFDKEFETEEQGYTLDEFNSHVENTKEAAIHTYDNMADYLAGKKFTVAYGGQSKQVELITKEDAEALKTAAENGEDVDALFAGAMRNHLDKAFGSGKIEVGSTADGRITFTDASDDEITLTVTSGDYAVRKETGLDKMSSNKISTGSSLYENRERFGFDADISKEDFENKLKDEGFTINGVTIDVTADMTVNQLMDKINSSDAGVKITYLNTSNKFSIVSQETGSGRDIEIGDGVKALFGEGKSVSGQDAVMYVDYGTGEAEKIVSSTNTFDMDGLKITVSGEFGIEKDENGNAVKDASNKPKFDNTQALTFNASADIDKATEAVKKFIEDYNAMVKAINTEIITKPDKSYGPLTDAQKDEMNDTSIENWENKAKQGLLFNNSTMRDLSMDIQGVLTALMGSGVAYDDLEEMGISMSDDLYDGGTLKFDEAKFRAAMQEDPEKVGDVFAGGGDVKKGLGAIVNDTLKKYATRYSYQNDGSYGRLVEEAGSERITLSLQNNTIYNQLKDMQETLASLQAKLQTEQDSYIRMFTQMEKALSNMNSQSGFLSSIGG